MAAKQPSKESIRQAISDVLKDAELSELTSRIVRNCLEEKFKVSLKLRKKEVDELLMALIAEQEKAEEDADNAINGTNGDAVSDDEESDSEEEEKPAKKRPLPKTSASPNKKHKPISSAVAPDSDSDGGVDDAAIARKMHENERGLRVRTKKQQVKKTQKTPKTKDPSRAKTGFGKLMVLSPDLAEILGSDQMSRAEVVKSMWAIIKERNLMDPKDKRFHICDAQLIKVFGIKRIKTFSMMKYLKHHVKDPSLIA